MADVVTFNLPLNAGEARDVLLALRLLRRARGDGSVNGLIGRLSDAAASTHVIANQVKAAEALQSGKVAGATPGPGSGV